MNTLEVHKTKIDRVASTMRVINADSSGNLPTKIEVLRVGMWMTPYHGDFMIRPEDLLEYVSNFENGVGLVDAGIGAPIDFSHESHEKAAGWIKKLTIQGDALVAEVEWSTAGKDALLGGLFKCFSPEFYPKGRGGWEDPESYGTYVENVLVGGGLTNIPLFKGLAPVMASASDGNRNVGEDKNVIYIKASEIKENTMNLADILAKDPTALSDAEKDFLTTNKDQLSAEDKTKFGFETEVETPAVVETPVVEAPVVDAETAAVAASVKSGESVVIKASELAALKASTAKFERKEAEAKVTAHIARGAIKADQLEKWTNRLLADASIEEDLSALPSNDILASEQGSDAKAGDATSAIQRIQDEAKKLMESDAKLTIGDATSKVLASNPELEIEYNNEMRGIK